MSDLPLFGLAMIVKDEEARISRCLESLKPLIGYWCISDTGSSDATIAIIRETLDGIPGELIESPFRGMGHNRSEVFAAIRGKCQFYFASDADMEWSVDPGFVPDPDLDAYQIGMQSGPWSWRLPLVLSGTPALRSIGRYHEYTARADGLPLVSLPTDAVRVAMPAAAPTTREKLLWQMSLVGADLAENPLDARSVFYAAQLARDLGQRDRARDLYLRRVALGGWEEEAFWAQYEAAKLADWPARAAELMAAWERRPQRLEPLRDLVRELNDRGHHHVAYALACVPVAPTTDITFTEPAVYAWEMTFQRSIAAWWVGWVDECRTLSDELLARDDIPADVRAAVERNRSLCEPRAVA